MIGKASHNSEILARQNVMTPLNWVTVLVEGTLIPTGAFQHNNWYGIVCFILAVLLIVGYFGVYAYFMRKAPNRLQSEKYQLMQQQLITAGNIQLQNNSQVEVSVTDSIFPDNFK